MKISTFMIKILLIIFSSSLNSFSYEMQHGFILSNNDTLGSHLVANGHHSRQVEILGTLRINNINERVIYNERKLKSTINQTYFLFQAQQIDLSNLVTGKILTGHIIESKVGNYEPKNIIVKSATFQIQSILLNILNPFFVRDTK